jgi:hypothetical protein
MKESWNGIMKILEIQHIRDNKVIWENKNLYNTLHVGGEAYLLACCFVNPGTFPPTNYYFGLDNRATIDANNIITDLYDEPISSGYLRAPVGSSVSSGGFTLEIVNGVWRATGQIVTFSATGSGWGPVSNLFLATTADNSGILLASSKLSNPITLSGGDSVNVRMSLALKDVPI